MSREPFLTKLTLRNFRSIREETVEFANPLLLVGKNGSGKSNFIDALAFLSECADRSLQSVLDARGGIEAIGHLDTAFGEEVSIRADFTLPNTEEKGYYAFSIAVPSRGVYRVVREHCEVQNGDALAWFDRSEDQFRSSISGLNFVPEATRLLLPILSGVADFFKVVNALSSIRIYKIDPDQLKMVQDRDSGRYLKRDGSNVASVLLNLSREDNQMLSRIGELLGAITPGIAPLKPQEADKLALLFEQQWGDNNKAIFPASAMSDGTLTMLALIVASMQQPPPVLLAIEEPELHLYPEALDMVIDTVESLCWYRQVILTTHSPELMDAKWFDADNFRVVQWKDRQTRIARLGEVPVKALQKHLMGAGELLLANALDAEGDTSEEIAAGIYAEIGA